MGSFIICTIHYSDTFKDDRLAGHATRTRELKSAYKILVGKPGGKGLIGRPRSTWEDNIKMHLRRQIVRK
jgi:hypothetical protein